MYFLKADTTLDKSHGVNFLASEKHACMWYVLSVCGVFSSQADSASGALLQLAA